MIATRDYPVGRGGIKSRWRNGELIFYKADGTTEIYRISPAANRVVIPGLLSQIRTRFTVAQVNAGATLLPAVAGLKYRLIEGSAISVGGAAGAVTTVDIKGIQSAASVKLVAFAQASLTQSALLNSGGTGAAILTDGASFAQCDVNTAITVGITGSSITVATSIDIIVQFALEP